MAEITEGNYLVMNAGRAVLTGFNFMLRVEALFDMPLKAVRSFTRELEFDYIQEGGLNDYVHMRRKGISKPFTFEIDRYVGINYIDPLPLGANLLLPLVLMVSRIPGQFIPLISARTYTFTGCTVIKKTYGELDGNKSELLVETVTIAYRELVVLDAPWSEAAGEAIAGENTSNNALSDTKEDKLRRHTTTLVAECDKLLDNPKLKDKKAILDKMPKGDDKNKTEEENKKDKAAYEEAKKPYDKIMSDLQKARQEAVDTKLDATENELNDAIKKINSALSGAETEIGELSL